MIEIETDILKALEQLADLIIQFIGSAVPDAEHEIEHFSQVSADTWIDFLRAIGGDVDVR